MNRAFNQRALETLNPKNIMKAPQNIKKLGRTTELIGKKAKTGTSTVQDTMGGALSSAGRGLQAVAKKLP